MLCNCKFREGRDSHHWLTRTEPVVPMYFARFGGGGAEEWLTMRALANIADIARIRVAAGGPGGVAESPQYRRSGARNEQFRILTAKGGERLLAGISRSTVG